MSVGRRRDTSSESNVTVNDRDCSGPPPPLRHERPEGDEDSDELCQPGRPHRDVVADACSIGEFVDEQRRNLAFDQRVDEGHQHCGRDRGGEQVAEEAIALGGERDHQQCEVDDCDHDFQRPQQDALDRRAEEAEEGDDVLLEAEDRILDPHGEGEEYESDGREHDQAQHVLG